MLPQTLHQDCVKSVPAYSDVSPSGTGLVRARDGLHQFIVTAPRISFVKRLVWAKLHFVPFQKRPSDVAMRNLRPHLKSKFFEKVVLGPATNKVPSLGLQNFGVSPTRARIGEVPSFRMGHMGAFHRRGTFAW